MLYNPNTDRRQDHLRHRCRNPRCRGKLPEPVSNSREAFCTRGCYSQFYRKRCLVCEKAIEQPSRGTRLICEKAKCRSAWRASVGFGRYLVSSSAESTQEVPENIGSAKPSVAGPGLDPSAFHCATVPDGLDCQWEGGEYRRLEAKNKAGLRAARELDLVEIEQAEIQAGGYFGEPGWREVISPDGVACFVTRYAIVASASALVLSSASIMSPPVVGDGLDIPHFLKREISRSRDQPQENGGTPCTAAAAVSSDR